MEIDLTIASAGFASKHPELYHYTGFDGLRGIFQSNTLWATNYRHLNDTTEVFLLKEYAIKELTNRFKLKLIEKQRTSLRVKREIEKRGGLLQVAAAEATNVLNGFYEVFFEGKRSIKYGEPYITSFCAHTPEQIYEQENGLLSQWRGYAGGGGYCLVFDTAEIINLMTQEFAAHFWLHLNINQVTYISSDSSVIPILSNTIDRIDDFFGHTVEAALAGNLNSVGMPEDVVVSFLAATTLSKHEGFKEESEVRIVTIPATPESLSFIKAEHPEISPSPLPELLERDIKQRAGRALYLRLFDGLGQKLPIKRIIVGPSPKQDENYAAAQKLVKGTIRVVNSKTPFIG